MGRKKNDLTISVLRERLQALERLRRFPMDDVQKAEVLRRIDRITLMIGMLEGGIDIEDIKMQTGKDGFYSREGGLWFYNWIENGDEIHQRLDPNENQIFET